LKAKTSKPQQPIEIRIIMTVISQLFDQLRRENRRAFIPFMTAGDPDSATTQRAVARLVKAGASLVEIGFPYSDPIADGPVIQASYTRALALRPTMTSLLEMCAAMQHNPDTASAPRVGMLSYSLIHRREPARFVADAAKSGLSGLIVPDLPVEESAALRSLCAAAGLDLILLVTPTTPRDRALRILDACSGFVYCVSIAGITGERTELPASLIDQLGWLRSQTKLPLCVGFGVSRPDQAAMLRPHVDGIIVGSALVRQLDRVALEGTEVALDAIENLARSLVSALNT
jgi:tryptophan synthase alpha chain